MKMTKMTKMNKLAITIGTVARAARTALKITEAEMADRARITADFYRLIEQGKFYPSVGTLVRMADALGVSADELLGRAQKNARPRSTPVADDISNWQLALAMDAMASCARQGDYGKESALQIDNVLSIAAVRIRTAIEIEGQIRGMITWPCDDHALNELLESIERSLGNAALISRLVR